MMYTFKIRNSNNKLVKIWVKVEKFGYKWGSALTGKIAKTGPKCHVLILIQHIHFFLRALYRFFQASFLDDTHWPISVYPSCPDSLDNHS